MSRFGYQPLSQTQEDNEELDVSEEPAPRSTANSTRGLARTGRPVSIDLGKLDNAFRKWTESIAHKVKRKKKIPEHSGRREIFSSVFEPTVIAIPTLATVTASSADHKPPLTDTEFNAMADSIRDAIHEGIHPKMITKGSSGSYFARAKVEGRVQTVAVFKPMDEEPYGRLNPKTMKWIHRKLRWLIPFGRACLIPNLSYISEAAASLLDTRLDLHIVPPTKLVSLSSVAFFYDWIDRSAVKKGKPLPEKIGSLQYFLHGYSDASDFLRKHPLPGRAIVDTFDDTNHRQGSFTKKILNTCKIVCGKTGGEDAYDDADYEEEERVLFDSTEESDTRRPFYWTMALQQSFRAELEKLVILDYLMLNTDRGADNYMIRYCEGGQEKCFVDVAPSLASRPGMPVMTELRKPEASTSTQSSSSVPSMIPSVSFSQPKNVHAPHITIAAIDNSLSFPHMHPNGWRSYTYGWLFLPVSVIGNPFSEQTRNHFLPLLTSKTWWEETAFQLRTLHSIDAGFHPQMFAKQLAVLKGQAYNIVESLRHADEGPLELTRRSKVLVWDDLIEIADEEISRQTGPLSASPQPSMFSVPLPKRPRSRSSASEFPPPMRRTSTDAFGVPRPVSFASKFQRGVHPGTTGVTVLEHLERLDAVEASLHRLGGSEIDEEEVDVGESSSQSKSKAIPRQQSPSSRTGVATSPFSPPSSPLATVHEVDSYEASVVAPSSSDEDEEQDLVAMSKSVSHAEPSSSRRWPSHGRYPSSDLDWMQVDDNVLKRTVIVERLVPVNSSSPLCSCW